MEYFSGMEKQFEVILEEKRKHLRNRYQDFQQRRSGKRQQISNFDNKIKSNKQIRNKIQIDINNTQITIKTTKYLFHTHHISAMLNQTNLFYYYTPTKLMSKEVTKAAPNSQFPLSTTTLSDQKLSSKIENLTEESVNYDEESQMTQRLLPFNNDKPQIPFDKSFSKVLFTEQEQTNQMSEIDTEASEIVLETSPFNTKSKQQEETEEDFQNAKTLKLIKGFSINKQIKKVNSNCSIKISKFDSVRSLQLDEKKRSSTFSEKVTKLITQIKNNKDETKRALSPARNAKLNAILNKSSLKDRYRHLLGSKVFEIQNAENQELLNLMKRVDEIMIRRHHSFLSELIAAVNGLTIQKMNCIMNIIPNLYYLSLKPNKFQQQDMLIQLPNSENQINIQEWKEQRFADFKQRLYYSEKQQQNENQQPGYASQKLTATIKEGLCEKQNQLNKEFTDLLSSQSNQQLQQQMIINTPLQTVALFVKEYFESRNVSNIFKINIVEQIAKYSNISLVVAETKLNDLIISYPSFLTEVKSSMLGSIIRINYSFNIESILN